MSDLPLTLSLYSANNAATLPHQRTLRFHSPLDLVDCEMALERLQLPISWPNVNSANGYFSYIWVDGQTYAVTLQPGELSQAAIAAALQQTLFANGHYLVNASTGVTNYYLGLQWNSNLYRTVITATPLPTSMPSGFAYGTSLSGAPAWTLPSSAKSPQLVVPPLVDNNYGALQPFGQAPPTTSFSTLVGVVPGTYPASSSSVLYATAGTLAPSSLVSTVLVACDRVNSAFNSNTNLLYSFTPSAGYANLCDEQPSTPQWLPCGGGKAQSLTLSLLDQNGMPLQLLDPSVHVRLTIRRRR